MAKYLDKIGLSYFWSLIKSKLIPTGGQEGQVLAKASSADDDVEWISAGTNNIIGDHLIAASLRQIVIGQYNEADTDEHAIIVGNGTSDEDRSNTFAVKRSGDISTFGTYPFTYQDAEVDTSLSNNGLSEWKSRYLRWLDKAGRYFAWVTGGAGQDGSVQVNLATRNFGTGANVDNMLSLGVTNSGDRTVSVSEAAPWREAIGAVATNDDAAINADTFASAERAIVLGGDIHNSASTYNGRHMNLYVKTNGLNTYINASGSQAAATPWSLYLPSGATDLTLQTTSLNLTVTNIGSGTKTLYLAKYGRIVIATYGTTINAKAANTTYSIGTIPSGYRPARQAYAYSRGVTNSVVSTAAAAARWTFNTNGTIQIQVGVTGEYEHHFTAMWWTS